jgi:uncharacterized protein YbcI
LLGLSRPLVLKRPGGEGTREALALTSPETGPTRGQAAQAISNAAIRLMRDYTGRGPTQAHTTISDNHVIVVMRDTLLKAERSLIDDGQSDPVIAMRRRFQRTMERDFVAAVVEHTGREVEAFLSDNHINPDIAVEVFILKPQADGDTAPNRGTIS